jgi:amidase
VHAHESHVAHGRRVYQFRSSIAGTAAFPHDQQGERHDRTLVVNGKRVPVTDHLFWAGYGDLTCLAFARLLEREFQAFVPPPGHA